MGLAIAWRLATDGFGVTVIERGETGQEASWAAAGMLVPDCEFEETTFFSSACRQSLRMYPAFVEALEAESGSRIDFRRFGTLYPAFDDRDQKNLEARLCRQRQEGVAVQSLTLKEVRRLEPNLTSKVQMALYYPENNQVENRDVVKALRVAAERVGAEIRPHTEALRVLYDTECVRGVETATGTVGADIVINATGSSSRYLSGLPGVCSPPVRPVRGQMLALSVVGDPPFRHTIYSSKAYLVPRTSGRLLVGATVEEAGFKNHVTATGALRLLRGAIEVAPALRDFPIESMWAGLRPATPDGWPVIGPTPLKGLYLATGHYRNGILMAPLTAAWMAEMLTGCEVPPAARPFLLERFHASAPPA